MKNLNKTEVAEFLKIKKDRLEKLGNFIEIATEMAVETKNDKKYKTMIAMADKASEEATIIYDEIDFIETVDNSIRTKEAGGFMAQFIELSDEDIAKVNKMILEFLEQIVWQKRSMAENDHKAEKEKTTWKPQRMPNFQNSLGNL